MRSNGLTANNWQVVTKYIDVLGPLKECTKRLEGKGMQGTFDLIAEICNGLGRGCLGCAASVSGHSDEAEG
jgi:hypothetical protein